VAVDRRKDIDASTKCTYLLGALQGEAEAAVASYEPTEENYPEVLRVLKERFGDSKLVKSALEAELINLPHTGDSIKAMRKTSEDIERICRQFVQLGGDEDGGMFLTTAKSKYPEHVLTELAKEEYTWKLQKKLADPAIGGDVKWSMADFREGLKRYLAIREEVAQCVKSVKAPARQEAPKQGAPPHRQRDSRESKETRAFGASVKAKQQKADRSQSERPQSSPGGKASRDLGPGRAPATSRSNSVPPCPFDGKPHWAKDCRTVTDIEERKKILAQQNRCFQCLRTE